MYSIFFTVIYLVPLEIAKCVSCVQILSLLEEMVSFPRSDLFKRLLSPLVLKEIMLSGMGAYEKMLKY